LYPVVKWQGKGPGGVNRKLELHKLVSAYQMTTPATLRFGPITRLIPDRAR
jgi:hypothetical protein